mmetsp:Transcript_3785/g.6648  ORF Transcript_3785/g.6648 Transcript_3785/m.6648 type:complete len:232 (-) Transcript_3785:384-1079(-)
MTAATRVKDTAIVKPVVYGSIAFFLGKKAVDSHSHRWSIYLRGLEDEDLSYFVKRVEFTLHPSCQIPLVVCEEPPYVVTQTGWGEFDARITIVLKDENETRVNIIHQLRLYPPGVSATNTNALMRKPVVNEHYEEIIFHEPTQDLHALLLEEPTRKGVSPPELIPYFTQISETDSMKQVVAAQSFVNAEMQKTLAGLASLQEEIELAKATKKEQKPQPVPQPLPPGVAPSQ